MEIKNEENYREMVIVNCNHTWRRDIRNDKSTEITGRKKKVVVYEVPCTCDEAVYMRKTKGGDLPLRKQKIEHARMTLLMSHVVEVQSCSGASPG